jgi:cysteine dioxygenase
MSQILTPTSSRCRAIVELLDYLDGLQGPAELDELANHVRQASITFEDVADCARFSMRGYARNLMHAGEWYHALVLCWLNGQRSPIHDHRGSSCAVRVLKGVMTETRFHFAPNGQVCAQGSRDYPVGSVIASRDADMHQVSNLQAGNAELVTLHVYSPPLLNMGTYSLMDNTRGIEPMFADFGEMDGI